MTPALPPEGSLQAAADALRLLAACFYPPDPSLLQEERVCENLGDCMEGFSPEAAQCARRLGDFLANTPPEDLRVEHARLFLGPFEVAAPPYGSVYRDGPKVLMGPSTLAVQRAYRKAGLTLAPDFHEVPDHVAAELEFAAYLLAGDGGDAAAAAAVFLREHLLPWAPAFCDRVEAESRNGFYATLARCLRAGLRDLAAALSAAPAGESAGGGATGHRPHASP